MNTTVYWIALTALLLVGCGGNTSSNPPPTPPPPELACDPATAGVPSGCFGLAANARLSASECAHGQRLCAESAPADWTVLETLPQVKTVKVPYGSATCPNQYVAEISLSGRNLANLYYARALDSGPVTKEACEDVQISVSAFRQLADGTWELFDSYPVGGIWLAPSVNTPAGTCQTKAAGLIGPTRNDHNATNGYPYSWVDVSGGVQKVRIVVVGGTHCNQAGLALAFDTDP